MNETTTHMQATRDSSECVSPQRHPCGGARRSQHAPPASPENLMMNPNPYPLGRWTSTTAVHAGSLSAVKPSVPICGPEGQTEAMPESSASELARRGAALDDKQEDRRSRHESPRTARRSLRPSLPANLLEAPLRELFWSQPDTERLAEAQQRIADFLSAAVAQEPIQLFDDLYELPAC